MQLYVLDRSKNVLATTSSQYNDKHHKELTAGVSSFEFDINKNDEAAQYMVSGNYITTLDDQGRPWSFTILYYDEYQLYKTIYCEDVGIELYNKACDIWYYTEPHPFEYYLDLLTDGTPWELGVNQLSNLSRTLNYTGRDTGLGRLLSVLKEFDDAECIFNIQMKGPVPVKYVIDVYKKIGTVQDNIQISYNEELNDIKKTETRQEFVTALAGVGSVIQNTETDADGTTVDNNKPQEYVNFADLEYDDGSFYTTKGDKLLRARTANAQFNPGDQGYIEDFYEYDTKSSAELFNRTLTQIKTRSQPQFTYEADVKVIDPSLDIGDTVTIIDYDYNPALYLQARVATLDKSYTDTTKGSITFTNYVVLTDTVTRQIAALKSKVNGIKNGSSSYVWIRYADDDKGTGISQSPKDKTYVAILAKVNQPVPSDNPNDYAGHWVRIAGEDGLNGQIGPQGHDGADGIPGKDGRTSYTHIAYADTATGGGFSQSSDNKKYIGIYADFEATDSTDVTKYNWSLIKGADGANGKDGVPGKAGTDGKTPYFHIAYADSADGNTNFSLDTPGSRKYIGSYTDFTQADSDNKALYSWQLVQGPKGDTGADGVAGKDGIGIKSTAIAYQLSSSGTTAPIGTWSSTVPTLTKGQYLWTRTTLTYTDNSSELVYSVSYVAKDGNNGTDGVAGKDGVGIKSTTITYQSGTSGTVQPTGTWVVNPPNVAGGNYLWTRTVWSYTDGTSETGYSVAKAGEKGDKGDAGADGLAGKNGIGIKSTAITYALGGSGTATPTTGWTTSVPSLVKGQYLWTKTVWTYTDNSFETGYSVTYISKDGNNGSNGLAGKDGTGIKTTTITYAGSTSGTTAPTSGWTSTVPTVAAGSYLWTKTVWAYTDNTSETGYSVAMMGVKGDTGSILGENQWIGYKYSYPDSTRIYPNFDHIKGLNPIVTRIFDDSTTFSFNDDYYIAHFQSNLYVNIDKEITTTVSHDDDLTIYCNDEVVVSKNTTINTPYNITFNLKAGWNKIDVLLHEISGGDQVAFGTKLSNLVEHLSYIKGPQGDQGIKGPSGTDGKTSYTHIAYANSATGEGFSEQPAGKTFIGMYVDFTSTDSTDVTKYKWTLVKGSDGANGTPGKAGADGRTPYLHTAYSWSADGTDRFMTVYPHDNLAALSALSPWQGAPGDTIEVTMQKVAIHSSGTSYFGFKIFDSNAFTPDTRFYVQFDFKPTSGIVMSIGGHCTDTFADVENIKINGQVMATGSWQNGVPYAFTNGQTYHIELEAVTHNNPDTGTAGLFIQPNRVAFGIAYDAEITHLKFENQSRTIYTPAPSDDYANAYPTFMGTYTDFTQADSTNPAKYVWSLIKGEDGANGKDGQDAYLHIAYANSVDGKTNFTTDQNQAHNRDYLGTYSDNTKAQSTDPTKYTWQLTRGAQGLQGQPGAKDVPVVIMSSTAPPSPKNGDFWYQTTTDASGQKITGFSVYSDGKWVPSKIDQSTLVLTKLVSVEIDSATINSPDITVPFDYFDEKQIEFKGSMEFKDGMLKHISTDKAGGMLKTVVNPTGYTLSMYHNQSDYTQNNPYINSAVYADDISFYNKNIKKSGFVSSSGIGGDLNTNTDDFTSVSINWADVQKYLPEISVVGSNKFFNWFDVMSSVQSHPNLLRNSTFINGQTNWDGFGPQTYMANVTHDGNFAVCIDSAGGANFIRQGLSHIPDPGHKICVSYWADISRADGGVNGGIFIDFLGSNHNYACQIDTVNPSHIHGWRFYMYDPITVPDGTTGIRFSFYNNDQAGNKIYYAQPMVSDGDVLAPYMPTY